LRDYVSKQINASTDDDTKGVGLPFSIALTRHGLHMGKLRGRVLVRRHALREAVVKKLASEEMSSEEPAKARAKAMMDAVMDNVDLVDATERDRSVIDKVKQSLDKLTNHLTVELLGSKKVLAGGKSGKAYTTYTVSLQLDGRLWTVHRRYSQFNNLSRIIIKSMPQVVPLLPTFPSKTMFGSLSSDTIKLRQEKLSLYLSKLIKIPEVWRSPEMADFFDDSAKILANLTVNLRVERIVHMQRLVTSSKIDKALRMHALREMSKNTRGSFHTVTPLEATGVNYFGSTTTPAVNPRRRSLLSEVLTASPKSSPENIQSSGAGILGDTSVTSPFLANAPSEEVGEKQDDRPANATSPPPPPPAHSLSDESEEERDDETVMAMDRAIAVPRPAPPPDTPPSSAEEHSSVEDHSSADESVEEEALGFVTDVATADVAARREVPSPGSSSQDKARASNLWKYGAELALGANSVNILEHQFQNVVLDAVATRNASLDVDAVIRLPPALAPSSGSDEDTRTLMEHAQKALDDIDALERAGILSLSEPLSYRPSGGEPHRYIGSYNNNSHLLHHRRRSSHHAVIHVKLPAASTPAPHRITVASDPVMFENLRHPETGILRAGIQLSGPELKPVEAKWKESTGEGMSR
jgi:hypothetical protein